MEPTLPDISTHTLSGGCDSTARLVAAAAAGDQASLESLLSIHTHRLTRMIALRTDRRLSRRFDVDDVLQEVHLQASQHLADYLRDPVVPFHLWLRGVAVNVLLELHRRHMGTRMRDVRVEVPLDPVRTLEASSQVLAGLLADTQSSPSNAAIREELKVRLESIIDCLSSVDKEVLALRHFEQLSPQETAQVLQISEKAAGMRYMRALKKLRDAIKELPGGLSQWRL